MSDAESNGLFSGLSSGPSAKGGRVRDLGARVNGALDSLNATSKSIEETAGWVAVTLALVAVVSIAALGLAVIALIGSRNCGRKDDDA